MMRPSLDVAPWEIHEALIGQVLLRIEALQDPTFPKQKASIDRDLGMGIEPALRETACLLLRAYHGSFQVDEL
jgi:hypothetical protein